MVLRIADWIVLYGPYSMILLLAIKNYLLLGKNEKKNNYPVSHH